MSATLKTQMIIVLLILAGLYYGYGEGHRTAKGLIQTYLWVINITGVGIYVFIPHNIAHEWSKIKELKTYLFLVNITFIIESLTLFKHQDNPLLIVTMVCWALHLITVYKVFKK